MRTAAFEHPEVFRPIFVAKKRAEQPEIISLNVSSERKVLHARSNTLAHSEKFKKEISGLLFLA